MQYYDPGRAYVHSRTLRWSWGPMLGRQHDWGRAVDALPLPDRVRAVALAGFSGIWVDRWGYTGEPRPRFEDLESELAAIVGPPVLVSASGRYSFFDVRRWREALEARLGAERAAQLRRRLLADMPIGPWVEGCGEEAKGDDGWWRACGEDARFELRNWRPGAIRVALEARLRTSGEPRAIVVSGPGFEDRLTLSGRPQRYARVFDVGGVDWPEKRSTPCPAVIRFRAEAGRTSSAGTGGLLVGDLAYETRRLIGGVPVDADGGVAVRTRY
jgi:hypothetical protein